MTMPLARGVTFETWLQLQIEDAEARVAALALDAVALFFGDTAQAVTEDVHVLVWKRMAADMRLRTLCEAQAVFRQTQPNDLPD